MRGGGSAHITSRQLGPPPGQRRLPWCTQEGLHCLGEQLERLGLAGPGVDQSCARQTSWSTSGVSTMPEETPGHWTVHKVGGQGIEVNFLFKQT